MNTSNLETPLDCLLSRHTLFFGEMKEREEQTGGEICM
ncbi:hypothetical protein GBAR_LOCUS17968 [Geodia barretti]|uniref:Uncharacterized protein n=1 Tax=Geodia barretti TaxID=519541 RepID=A0AA35WSZ1_GEOBA|nr:hypothetical protein GBAR_LOCUS17968 [Geodia barretti]